MGRDAPDGRRITVADMPLDDILGALADGAVEILDSNGMTDTEAQAAVMARLEIELLIRRENLRAA